MLSLFNLLKILAVLFNFQTVIGLEFYGPRRTTCPTNKNILREANSLNDQETQWLANRHSYTTPNLEKFLRTKTSLSDEEISILSKVPDINIGLAFSGGGYRAMLNGAGAISALDNRTRGAFEHGLGGLLESTTYVSALSGGNWMTGALYMNDFVSVQDIVDGKIDIWDLRESIFLPKGIKHPIETTKILKNISVEVQDKKVAGFETSITDIWGRSLSRDFFPLGNDYGVNVTWSSIATNKKFLDGSIPMPISVADGKIPFVDPHYENGTVFEFTPFELGSWDKAINAFVNLKYLGTKVVKGLINESTCIENYDNAGFVMGTSSSLFSSMVSVALETKIDVFNKLRTKIYDALNDFSEDNDDVSIISPSPFYQNPYTNSSVENGESLYLVDGGLDGQNVPYAPLIQPKRRVDLIISYDNSNDIENFPSGCSLKDTYERQFQETGILGSVPYVPDINTFVNLGLNTQPTFFGCDGKNQTFPGSDLTPPIIIYNPNAPISYLSNTSTFQMKYTMEERNSMIQNGFELASRNNLTIDDNWATCIGCAAIRRSQERLGIEQSDICKKCFNTYCWDGTINSSNYSHTYPASMVPAKLRQTKMEDSSVFSNFVDKIEQKIFPDGITMTKP